MKVLVTGGTGYIGSHTCVELISSGYTPVIVDNLYNSDIGVIDKIEAITGVRPVFYEGDVRNEALMDRIFVEHAPGAVIHFAGYKAVSESVKKPLMYYENNIGNTVVLCNTMIKHNCRNLVFSSSATVYGTSDRVPFTEDLPLGATNPYGRTKLMIEQILTDLYNSDNEWNITLLRYFNPVGAHASGLIGEEPNGIPNNLMPYVTKVALGELPCLNVFGNDYNTPDGTGVRDYIHIVDLAKGHIKAIEHLKGLAAYNLGTGVGYSVLDIINAFERVNGVKVPYKIAPRRAGDIASCYADPSKARRELGWTAQSGIDEMCASAWNYALKSRSR